MSVTLVKGTEGNATRTRRPELNYGHGQLEFIAGFPTARPRRVRQVRRTEYVTGGRVAVCGIRINAQRVASLDINGPGGSSWLMESGLRVPVATDHTVGEWFRFLLDSRTFAYVEFLR